MENSKWIVTPDDVKNVKPISEHSHCLITIFSDKIAFDKMDLIEFGHKVNSEMIIQIGGKLTQDFDSRRPFIHLHKNKTKVTFRSPTLNFILKMINLRFP